MVSHAVLFMMIWWVILFTVLPFGIERDESTVKGSDQGAPKNPRIWFKLFMTTMIALIVWIAVIALLNHYIYDRF